MGDFGCSGDSKSSPPMLRTGCLCIEVGKLPTERYIPEIGVKLLRNFRGSNSTIKYILTDEKYYRTVQHVVNH